VSDAAQDFFDSVVEPALADYETAEAELTAAVKAADASRLAEARALAMRRARTAAIELHQFGDRVVSERPPWVPQTNLGGLRQWLMTQCDRRPDDVQVLHDVADAFKHAVLTNPRKGRSWFVQTDKAIVNTSTGYGALGYGEGKYGGIEEVIVEQPDGRKRSLSFVLGTAKGAWLKAMGR